MLFVDLWLLHQGMAFQSMYLNDTFSLRLNNLTSFIKQFDEYFSSMGNAHIAYKQINVWCRKEQSTSWIWRLWTEGLPGAILSYMLWLIFFQFYLTITQGRSGFEELQNMQISEFDQSNLDYLGSENNCIYAAG